MNHRFSIFFLLNLLLLNRGIAGADIACANIIADAQCLQQESLRVLEQLPSAKKMIKDIGRLEIKTGGFMGGGNFGSTDPSEKDPRTIFYSTRAVHLTLFELTKSTQIPMDKVQEQAVVLLGVFVGSHELRHLHSRRQLKKRAKLNDFSKLLETEEIAYARQAAVIYEALLRWPELKNLSGGISVVKTALANQQRALAWSRDAAPSPYPSQQPLESVFKADPRAKVAQAQERLNTLRSIEQLAKRNPKKFASTANRIPWLISIVQEDIKLWSNERTIEKVRAYYRKELGLEKDLLKKTAGEEHIEIKEPLQPTGGQDDTRNVLEILEEDLNTEGLPSK